MNQITDAMVRSFSIDSKLLAAFFTDLLRRGFGFATNCEHPLICVSQKERHTRLVGMSLQTLSKDDGEKIAEIFGSYR